MKKYSSAILSFLISGIVIGPVKAQSSHAVEMTLKLEDEILYMDSLFWQSYNACDIDKFKTFLTDDLEFYHDKGGLTTTLATFMESIESGLCGNENWRLRREVVEGSVKVFPVPDYGAIISGEHLFYIVENSTERLDGLATFVHVWQYKNGEWKMSRVLSYDHRPAPSTNIKG